MVMILGRLCLGDSGDSYMVTHYGKSCSGRPTHLITRYDVAQGVLVVDVSLTHRVTWFIGRMMGAAAINKWICLQYCTE